MKGMTMNKAMVLVLCGALAGCVVAETPASHATNPANDFEAYCAACHGSTGKGDGAMAGDLAKKPADLTTLAARNKGLFPTTKVMAQIWGYAGKKGKGVMPDFGPLLEGDTVPYDGGDGIETPTPVRLVALAEYLKTIQSK
jgi:mono/diheme cytochrome c family protein